MKPRHIILLVLAAILALSAAVLAVGFSDDWTRWAVRDAIVHAAVLVCAEAVLSTLQIPTWAYLVTGALVALAGGIALPLLLRAITTAITSGKKVLSTRLAAAEAERDQWKQLYAEKAATCKAAEATHA